MSEPKWLTEARKDIGQRETLGPNDSPYIRAMLASLSATWLKGQPWCGGAVAKWMKSSGIKLPKHWYRAKGWLDWGTSLTVPCPGCVVVLERQGGGHVFIAIGRDKQGRIVGIGGNQGDSVSIAAFDTSRVVGYRWPAEVMAWSAGLPLVAHNGASSTGEA